MSDQRQAPASGWYPDPLVPGQMRFWDGSAWTDRTFLLEAPARPVGYRFGLLAQGLRAGLILSLLIGLAETALYIWGLSMFDAAVRNGDTDKLSRFDELNRVLLVGEMVVLVVTGILWLVWQFQLARSAGPGELDRSPGMHVGSWFIPIANLVLVFQNVRDLWRRFVASPTSLLGWWWAATLLSRFVARLGTPAEDDHSVGSLQTQVTFWMISSVLGIVAAVLALVIVRRLTAGGLANSAPGAVGIVGQLPPSQPGRSLRQPRSSPPGPPRPRDPGARIF